MVLGTYLTLHTDVRRPPTAVRGLPATIVETGRLDTACRPERLHALPRPVRHRGAVQPPVFCQYTSDSW